MRPISIFVDHGAGISFVPLILSNIVNIESVICTEIETKYIDSGMDLWSSLGIGNKINFNRCSVVDFAYPENTEVSVVLFAQMLYRIPPEHRFSVLQKAIDALEPGGLLVINEIMNRPDLDKRYGTPLVRSQELLEYLHGHSVYVVRSANEAQNPVRAERAHSDDFMKPTNLVILVKD